MKAWLCVLQLGRCLFGIVCVCIVNEGLVVCPPAREMLVWNSVCIVNEGLVVCPPAREMLVWNSVCVS